MNQSTGRSQAWHLGTADKDALPHGRREEGGRGTGRPGTSSGTGPQRSAREGSRLLCCSMKEVMGGTR